LLASRASRTSRLTGASPGRVGGSGFTVIEGLVGTAIFLIVLFGVYHLYDACQLTFWKAKARAELQQDVRSALERMRRELRMAGYDPSATGQVAVQNPASSSLEFITDADDSTTSELVRYDRDSAAKTLRRTVKSWTGTGWGTASVTTLATHVESLTFQYYPSAAVPGLNRIQVTIRVSQVVPTQPAQQYQVSTEVFLRNL